MVERCFNIRMVLYNITVGLSWATNEVSAGLLLPVLPPKFRGKRIYDVINR